MVLAALRERIPRSGWAGLLVKPETVLGWHRALVRRKWAAYRGRPRRGRPPVSTECRDLIICMATEMNRPEFLGDFRGLVFTQWLTPRAPDSRSTRTLLVAHHR